MESDEECPDLIGLNHTVEMIANKDNKASGKVPVTIITGHLGSGKTTLLNYVLTEQHQIKVNIEQYFVWGRTSEF